MRRRGEDGGLSRENRSQVLIGSIGRNRNSNKTGNYADSHYSVQYSRDGDFFLSSSIIIIIKEEHFNHIGIYGSMGHSSQQIWKVNCLWLLRRSSGDRLMAPFSYVRFCRYFNLGSAIDHPASESRKFFGQLICTREKRPDQRYHTCRAVPCPLAHYCQNSFFFFLERVLCYTAKVPFDSSKVGIE
jgi:hypothetical protein